MKFLCFAGGSFNIILPANFVSFSLARHKWVLLDSKEEGLVLSSCCNNCHLLAHLHFVLFISICPDILFGL